MGERSQPKRARRVHVEPSRFRRGPTHPQEHQATGDPPIVVDVVRPLDLVAFTVEAHGFTLMTTASAAELRADPDIDEEDRRLVVRFGFQHLAEHAIYEKPEGSPAPSPDPLAPAGEPVPPIPPPGGYDQPGTRHDPPIDARPARASRLVFAVPDDTRIEFSTEGLLDAMSRLPMLVHERATPGEIAADDPARTPLELLLGGGIRAAVTARGIELDRSRGAGRRTAPTPDDVVANARAVRSARLRLATHGGTATASAAESVASEALAPFTTTIGDRTVEIPGLLGAGGLATVPDRFRRPRRRSQLSSPPDDDETAIEAPYRLVISPSAEGAWSHASTPVTPPDAPHRAELWHTRLAHREVVADGTARPDEKLRDRRIVRAVWSRDRETDPGWRSAFEVDHDDEPFRTSLDGGDRHMLVRQSAETWVRNEGGTEHVLTPAPIEARALWLSAVGATIDLHGRWDTDPYSDAHVESILLWDHVAPLGRDQFVRVMYPGYLYPFGHRAAMVKVTERRIPDADAPVAGLFQRKFIVVADPIRRYGDEHHRLPFREVRIRPLVTPTLDDPGAAQSSFFTPTVAAKPFRFVIDALDREDRAVRLEAPLLWVAAHHPHPADVEVHYRGLDHRHVPADGQLVAYAPVAKGGDTAFPTQRLSFDGEAGEGTSTPTLSGADIRLPVAEHLSPAGTVPISYADTFTTNGFSDQQNPGQVWAKVEKAGAAIGFGGTGAGSDKAGGFIAPSIPIGGLSRAHGVVGEITKIAQGEFDPAAFLAGALPKLFGIVPLEEIVDTIVPDVVSEQLGRLEALIADVQRAVEVAKAAAADAKRQFDRAANAPAQLKAEAEAARKEAEDVAKQAQTAFDELMAALATLADGDPGPLAAAFEGLAQVADRMAALATQLPPMARNQLAAVAAVLRKLRDGADLVAEIERAVRGVAGATEGRFRYEWAPELHSWPNSTKPILALPKKGLRLVVDGRITGDTPSVEVLAELSDFTLHLLPEEPLVRIPFEHLSFRGGSGGKVEVDAVLGDMEFLGVLGFVETLKRVIPFDGFSDPPYVDVSPEGLEAGFSQSIPSVAIGVFTLSNISLSADVQVPFLGSALTVGFGFCSRERPFTLAVAMLGGGGWVTLRLAPDGLDVLEVGLEAGASLSLDFGVASGSISAMIGIYIRLEGDGGSLTAYFRLRGEVDVLGLISASIELYLVLSYDFDTGKLVGEATITVEVDVLCFSGSVQISCRRQFAGSNGDPTFEDVMAVTGGTSDHWTDYCLAFAEGS